MTFLSFWSKNVSCSNFFFKISLMIFKSFVLINFFKISVIVFYFIFSYFVKFLIINFDGEGGISDRA
uniref:Uncharacterized protein n=1 Tax=Solanum lycopersicum TaxID=4081 RepID=A0A3Q7I2F1_SOLLC